MSRLNKDCGHPSDWLFRVRMDGRTYTYCMGCLIENAGLDNLEVYNNPYIKGVAKSEKHKILPGNKVKEEPEIEEASDEDEKFVEEEVKKQKKK